MTQRWSQHLGSHGFNLSTREVETRVIWLDRERNIRPEETGTEGIAVCDLVETGFQSEP